jgi:hypothetical protein
MISPRLLSDILYSTVGFVWTFLSSENPQLLDSIERSLLLLIPDSIVTPLHICENSEKGMKNIVYYSTDVD